MEEERKENSLAITDEEMEELLEAQQGELDAVLMYEALADAVEKKYPEDAAVFRQLAADEGRHAAVFRALSDVTLEPEKAMAFLLPKLYRLLGRKLLYPLIAKGEYAADDSYQELAERFPEVQRVKEDEIRHGDMVRALIGKPARGGKTAGTDAAKAEAAQDAASAGKTCPLANCPVAKPLMIAGAVCTLTGAVVISLAILRKYKNEA